MNLIMHQHIIATMTFPLRPLQQGLDLINTPEMWGTGALFSLGIPRFQTKSLSGIVQYQGQKCMNMQCVGPGWNMSMFLIGHSPSNQVEVVLPHMRVRATVEPLSEQRSRLGFLMTIMVCGQSLDITQDTLETMMEFFPWESCRALVERDPVLERWREPSF